LEIWYFYIHHESNFLNFFFFFRAQRYTASDDILQCLQEFSDEDFLEDDIDYEPEFIEQDDFSSDSEQSLFDENNLPAGDDVSDDDYFFYVGKDGETLWISNSDALNTTRRRTRAKNIVKIFPRPKGSAINTLTLLLMPFRKLSRLIWLTVLLRTQIFTL